MPRSAEDNQVIRDTRREELLEAALRAFAKHGFARTKVSDIAAQAGVSYGLVYHYFPGGKTRVFSELVETMIDRIEERFDAGGGTAWERLERSIELTRAAIECEQCNEADRLISAALVQGSVPREVRERLRDHITSIYERTLERIREAQADGDVDPDASPEELTSALMYLMRGVTLRTPLSSEVPICLPSTETLMRMLRPPAKARKKKPEKSR